jgi:1-acyl-sn-glycerol-3-phosphate acyltransferase
VAHPKLNEDITPMYDNIIKGLWPVLLRTWRHDWRGGEHVPTTGGVVAAANHLSYVDPFTLAQFLVAQGRAPRFLAKSALFGMPGVKSVMTGTGQIPVVRGSAQAVHAYEAALEAVGRGDCVCVLPEGTMTRDHDLWPMPGKTGAARIALSTGCPLVPIAMWGTQEVLYPYQQVAPRLFPRKTIKVYAGAPVDLDDLRGRPVTAETLRIATDRLMARITELLETARGEQAPLRTTADSASGSASHSASDSASHSASQDAPGAGEGEPS